MSLKLQSNRQNGPVQQVSGIGTGTALNFTDINGGAEPHENAELQALGTLAAAVNALARKYRTKPFSDKLAIADAFDLGVEAGLWSEDPTAFKARLARAARGSCRSRTMRCAGSCSTAQGFSLVAMSGTSL